MSPVNMTLASGTWATMSAPAEIDGHPVGKRRRWPGQAGDRFMALEQARETAEFAVPILLAAFDHHGARLVAHDHCRGLVGGGAEHAHRVVVGQHQMADWLVGDGTDALDDLLGQPRRRLRLDDHDRLIANDDTGVRIALGGEGMDVAADLGKGDCLFRHVAGGGELLGHAAGSPDFSTACSMAPKIEWPLVSFISMRTVSPNFRKGVTGLPVAIVSTVRISAMHE
jgi:hypothetical protein